MSTVCSFMIDGRTYPLNWTKILLVMETQFVQHFSYRIYELLKWLVAMELSGSSNTLKRVGGEQDVKEHFS